MEDLKDWLSVLLNMQSVLYLFATLVGALLFVIVFFQAPDYLGYVLGFLAISYCPLLPRAIKR
ncbi:MAG: hypothetical protein QXT86_11470 [Archaeoglobaceae archaeon]